MVYDKAWQRTLFSTSSSGDKSNTLEIALIFLILVTDLMNTSRPLHFGKNNKLGDDQIDMRGTVYWIA